MEAEKIVKVVFWAVVCIVCFNLIPGDDVTIETKSDYVGTTTTMTDAFGQKTTCRLVTIGDTSRMTCN